MRSRGYRKGPSRITLAGFGLAAILVGTVVAVLPHGGDGTLLSSTSFRDQDIPGLRAAAFLASNEPAAMSLGAAPALPDDANDLAANVAANQPARPRSATVEIAKTARLAAAPRMGRLAPPSLAHTAGDGVSTARLAAPTPEPKETIVASAPPMPAAGRFGQVWPADTVSPRTALAEATAAASIPAPEDAEAVVLADVPLPVAQPETKVASLQTDDAGRSGAPFGQMLAEAPAATTPSIDAPVPDRRPAPSKTRGVVSSRSSGALLAYAQPDDASPKSNLRASGRITLPGRGSGVAVYDISAATVYLPNGDRLEAHSGLGHMRDKPRYANQKNRGPTPPNVYDLVMRESLFHGVEAIRLLPSDGVNKFNRDGLLAHTYMLRGTAQSNGCVVFKDYKRFLKAFKRGKIDRMIVIPRISDLPTAIASL